MDVLQNLGTTAQYEDKPPPPPAVIRPFVLGDLKIVRYLIGKLKYIFLIYEETTLNLYIFFDSIGSSMMEPSSSANQAALWSPIILLIWAILTHSLVVYIGTGWPQWLCLFKGVKYVWGSWPYEAVQVLKVLPAIVSPPIVLLAGFEMKHRNMFEESMTRAIGEEDLIDVEGYYSTKDSVAGAGEGKKVTKEVGGRKGFFVLEYDNRIIGAFGIDGRKPGKVLDTIVGLPLPDSKKVDSPATIAATATTPTLPESPYPLRNRSAKTGIPSTPTSPSPSSSSDSTYTDTVQLRRFGTSLSFRPAGIDEDLINYAAAFAFSTASPSSLPPAKKLIYTLRPSIEKDLLAKLIAAGFKEVADGSELVYEPEAWKVEKLSLIQSLVNKVWPISLVWKTYALTVEDWTKRN